MKKSFRPSFTCFLVLSFSLSFLSACRLTGGDLSTAPTGSAYFRPPTLPVTPERSGITPSLAHPVDPTPACQNGLAFIADVTIPDGTPVEPGSAFEKTWEVENIGSCSWNAAYSIRHVGGSNMGVEPPLPLYPARPGTRARITILFTAPTESGTIHSAWRAYGADGQPFGDPFYVQVVVTADRP